MCGNIHGNESNTCKIDDNTHGKSYQLKLNDINYYVNCYVGFGTQGGAQIGIVSITDQLKLNNINWHVNCYIKFDT